MRAEFGWEPVVRSPPYVVFRWWEASGKLTPGASGSSASSLARALTERDRLKV